MVAGRAIARALTAPPAPRSYPLAIRAATRGTVTLDDTPQTRTAGTWGLFLDDGGHVRIEGRPEVVGNLVRWQLAEGQHAPHAGAHASWSGIAHRSPSDAGLASFDELIETPGGMMPAWVIPGESATSDGLWAVHIHGMGSTRAGTLRGVRVAARLGIPSLVATYRNTVEGPRWGTGRSSLGVLETTDVEAQLEHLLHLGAERFVLFGWSMGAQIALRLAASPVWRERVADLVLDSPVISWRRAIAANLRHSHLPGILAPAAAPWLRRPRLIGSDVAVDLREMDWVARSTEVVARTLVIHGTADWSAPISASRRFVAASGADRSLFETSAGHTLNWNVDPAAWEAHVAASLTGLPAGR